MTFRGFKIGSLELVTCFMLELFKVGVEMLNKQRAKQWLNSSENGQVTQAEWKWETGKSLQKSRKVVVSVLNKICEFSTTEHFFSSHFLHWNELLLLLKVLVNSWLMNDQKQAEVGHGVIKQESYLLLIFCWSVSVSARKPSTLSPPLTSCLFS